jgi:hypothetical protein
MRRLTRRVPGLGLALGAFLLFSAESIAPTEEEVECESAVAHLGQCCPDFNGKPISCVDGGCRVPDLSLSSSRAIEGMDCAAIQSANLCSASSVETRFGRDAGATP